jgi:adenosylcobinamide-phosphate synthase
VIVVAAALDFVVGDPRALPHPVTMIARAARALEAFVRPRVRDELLGGGIVTLAVVWGAAAFGAALERSPRFVRIVAAASTLASRSLLDHAAAVRDALEADDLGEARLALAHIVGRDTHDLDASEIARAAIESLAESTCDGIVAPLLFLAIGGLPWAFAYKAINTLDSLIGHIEPPYTYFGRIAARLDDVANFVPARISALTIALAAALNGGSASGALDMASRDGRKHRSPNAGVSEAAMSGALGVRLGGPARYDGVIHNAPVIGEEFRRPLASDVRRAMRVTLVASLLAVALAATVARMRRCA